MDPGLHGRQDTMGLVVHDPRANLTAYGPTVVIRTLNLGETVYSQLVVDLLQEGRAVVRRAAHGEITALHKAMQEGFGFDLEDLACSDEFILRPLLPDEVIHVGTQPPPVQEMGSKRFHYHPHDHCCERSERRFGSQRKLAPKLRLSSNGHASQNCNGHASQNGNGNARLNVIRNVSRNGDGNVSRNVNRRAEMATGTRAGVAMVKIIFVCLPQVREPLPAEEGGGYAVRNTTTGEKKPEMPPGKKPSKATASFWTDQGSVGMAGINFLLFHMGYFILYFADMSHRVWNDLKAAFKRGGTWRCVTYLTLVFNLNYKPFGKGAWMGKKKMRWQT